MHIVRKIPYRKIDDGFLHFDLYNPESDFARLIIHLGDGVRRTEMDKQILFSLLDANFAVASLSYRDIEDCRYGVRWLQTNVADAEIITEKIALWGIGVGGYRAIQLGLRGEADSVLAMNVDFPEGLHEDVAKNPAKFLLLQAQTHRNINEVTKLDKSLRAAKLNSQLVTLDSETLSDSAKVTVTNTMLTFFSRWV